MNAKRLTLVILIVAAVVAVVMYFAYMNTQVKLDDQMTQELLSSGTFQPGVSINGVDVSGLTMQDAQVAISPVINQMMNAGRIEFSVYGEDQPYVYSLEEMGLSVDPAPTLRDAMLYGREGTRWDLKHEDPVPKDFQLQKTFQIANVTTLVNEAESRDEWGENAVNGNYEVKKSKNEEDLTTGAEIVPTEPHDGYAIDKDSVISTIENQIMSESYAPFEAPMTVIESQSVVDTHGGELSLMGSKTTDFSTSKADRRYNIWKMADILNGQVLYPGEVFSVNDTAGDRNAENGWKEADGIENGQYTPQYGGGICQVSTTLYNACLMAEMDIVSRVPHTIAAKYVPKGLDATISTGGPDFKVENPYETPVYVVIKCNGSDGTLTAELWGYDDRNYRVRVYSEEDVDQREDLPKPQYQRNSELADGRIERVRGGQQKEVWNVYKDLIDKETDETIEEKVFVTYSTYNAISPLYDVGPGRDLPADGTPIEEVTGNVVTKNDDIQADPEPSVSVEPSHSSSPTQEPTSRPTQAPTQAPTQEPTQAPTAEPTQEPTQEPAPPSDSGGDGSGGEDAG